MRQFITIFGLLISIHSFAQHDWDSKNWNKESLGFGCSVDGQMTKPVLNMTQLFMEKRFVKIRKLLDSNLPADQFLATFILERLELKKELEIADNERKRILEIKNSSEMVPFVQAVHSGRKYPSRISSMKRLKRLFRGVQTIGSTPTIRFTTKRRRAKTESTSKYCRHFMLQLSDQYFSPTAFS